MSDKISDERFKHIATLVILNLKRQGKEHLRLSESESEIICSCVEAHCRTLGIEPAESRSFTEEFARVLTMLYHDDSEYTLFWKIASELGEGALREFVRLTVEEKLEPRVALYRARENDPLQRQILAERLAQAHILIFLLLQSRYSNFILLFESWAKVQSFFQPRMFFCYGSLNYMPGKPILIRVPFLHGIFYEFRANALR